MKKSLRYVISALVCLIFAGILYYFTLPAINIQSIGFWVFVIFNLVVLCGIIFVNYAISDVTIIKSKNNIDIPKPLVIIPIAVIAFIVIVFITNIVCSPLFNASGYAHRIDINEEGDFAKDIPQVDFNTLPLLDRASSEKLGDRVMGEMKEFVSQYVVSNQYTQINYNNEIIRVTPLDYAGFIKWWNNRDEGVKGYITVNSVTGKAKLVKLDKGMKYTPNAYFNYNLYRKLTFDYPTEIFSEAKFEIDNEGNPFYIVPTYGYTGFELKTRVTGVIIFNPIDGTSKKYDMKDVPTWVDNAYNAQLIIEQVDDWGTYNGGFWNSIFGQKNVVNTTEGYNYLAYNDDIYLYTGITSVLADESNLGFILSNMRTGETTFYSVPGAEEYSAMSSAEGQVQQMKYTSTFPLLINLGGKPTYLVSLKDAAGLVKMYGFIDVQDYQKVTVTDASKGIKAAEIAYINQYAEEASDDILIKEKIVIDSIIPTTISGNTVYYIESNGKKYRANISLSDELPFKKAKNELSIGYYETKDKVIKIEKIY